MKTRALIISLFLTVLLSAHDFTGNPVLPGYYADPSVVYFEEKYYVFATIDPWGARELALWETEDFINWEFHELNWPTKDQCKSATSTGSMVWAPSVIQGLNGKFYMYVSVGGEIYVGVAEKPSGPWKNAIENNQPLVANQHSINVHTIDAEAFIDSDGQAYLYWGSGWNWRDGHCLVAKLNDDMISFNGNYKDITPPGYFEAPFMLKYKSKYHLMYSEGKCTDSTYKVRYSTFDKPMGIWEDGAGKKILYSDIENNIIGPGHHTIFQANNQYYILYHRISDLIPKDLHRQICIDKIEFDSNGYIKKVIPTDLGVPFFLPGKIDKNKNMASGKLVLASSVYSNKTNPMGALDDSYATLWAAAQNDTTPWLFIDLRENRQIAECRLEFEFAHMVYKYLIEYSTDNINWQEFSDRRTNTERGSPIIDRKNINARYLKISFVQRTIDELRPGIWEISVY